MTKQAVVVVGAGGHGREALDILRACAEDAGTFECVGFVDEDESLHGSEIHGVPVEAWIRLLGGKIRPSVVVAVGGSSPRKQLAERADAEGLSFATLIHPTVVRTGFDQIGQGVTIAANSVISNRVQVGDHTYINSLCLLAHDVVVGSFCSINGGVKLSGAVHVKDGCEIGTGASVIQRIVIGEWSRVGAGAVVTKDIPAAVTAVGVPAVVIKGTGNAG